jgi:hypothetical protein
MRCLLSRFKTKLSVEEVEQAVAVLSSSLGVLILEMIRLVISDRRMRLKKSVLLEDPNNLGHLEHTEDIEIIILNHLGPETVMIKKYKQWSMNLT